MSSITDVKVVRMVGLPQGGNFWEIHALVQLGGSEVKYLAYYEDGALIGCGREQEDNRDVLELARSRAPEAVDAEFASLYAAAGAVVLIAAREELDNEEKQRAELDAMGYDLARGKDGKRYGVYRFDLWAKDGRVHVRDCDNLCQARLAAGMDLCSL